MFDELLGCVLCFSGLFGQIINQEIRVAHQYGDLNCAISHACMHTCVGTEETHSRSVDSERSFHQ